MKLYGLDAVAAGGVCVLAEDALAVTTRVLQALASLDTGALRCMQELESSGFSEEVRVRVLHKG
jgi:hypothetical protein